MAKEKLLCILKLWLQISLIMSSLDVFAEYEAGDSGWAQELAAMQISDVDFNAGVNTSKQHPNLQIFVSSTMPESVLANFARQASKYGGVLVFRGLPNGSMMELSDLVMRISDKDYPAAMQIDDAAFTLHSITRVPSFVLSQTKSDLSSVTDSNLSQFICYDKMVGNVPLSFVLEEFASSGDCAEFAAANLLQVSNR